MTNTARSTRIALAAIAGALLVCTAAVRPAHADTFHPFAGEEQNIERAGRPAWLREGMRITYEMGQSLRSGNARTGGSGGVGVMQIDVVGVGKREAALAFRVMVKQALLPGAWGRPVQYGITTPLGKGEKYWIHPQVLAHSVKVHEQGTTGWKVTEARLELAGTQWDCYALAWNRQGVVENRWYDKKTGLLIQQNGATRANGTRSGSHMKLLGLRQRTLPWIGGEAPAWVHKISSFEYESLSIVRPPPTTGYRREGRISITVQSRDPRFLVLKFPSRGNMIPDTGVAGTGNQGGIWLPPAALAKLRPQQVLDEDPHVDARVYVGFASTGENGRRRIEIAEALPGLRVTSTYDVASGLLVAAKVKVDVEHTTTTLKFVGSR